MKIVKNNTNTLGEYLKNGVSQIKFFQGAS